MSWRMEHSTTTPSANAAKLMAFDTKLSPSENEQMIPLITAAQPFTTRAPRLGGETEPHARKATPKRQQLFIPRIVKTTHAACAPKDRTLLTESVWRITLFQLAVRSDPSINPGRGEDAASIHSLRETTRTSHSVHRSHDEADAGRMREHGLE